ncbi:hypothetical protein [uncultured Arthrobacter sp.]|uniref:hypothetical protein n=1 Tax=uncultured Arthrobacter sp. TaxID=114050 RepID=UPI0028D10070|nr:hypothetical protein [uncultured Arthrobacter sp.]
MFDFLFAEVMTDVRFPRGELDMEWQHHLDGISADWFVEQFVDRGLTFQLADLVPFHLPTLCAPVRGERVDTRVGGE